jgi:hypothetical protein
MARSIEIVFNDQSGIHEVRNFAEELSRGLEAKSGWGQLSMADADRATAHIRISAVHARKISRVMAFIEALLKKHYLHVGVNVSHVEEKNIN